MKLLLIRHGPTEWNAQKRIQGRIDQPLSSSAIEQLHRRQLSNDYLQLKWYVSPLQRARQTAKLLGIADPTIEPALTEMNWGDWEGEILKPLRKQLGDVMRDNEKSGLDFCPPKGESPRQVQQRLISWFRQIAVHSVDAGAVVHKGIIRCVYSLATGWDMCGDSPVQFNWEQGHEFQISSSGEVLPAYAEINLESSLIDAN
jgi:broad specificity phosphatase PhoE